MRIILAVLLVLFSATALAGELKIDASSGAVRDKACNENCSDTTELSLGKNQTAYIRFDIAKLPKGIEIRESYIAFKLKSGSELKGRIYIAATSWAEDTHFKPEKGTLLGNISKIDCVLCGSNWFGINGTVVAEQILSWQQGDPNYGIIIVSNSSSSLYSSESDSSPYLLVGYDKSCEDFDGDGYGAGDCYFDTDCNDLNTTIYPGATETCNYVDDDCDGTKDDVSYSCKTCQQAGGKACNATEYCKEGYADVLDSQACCMTSCKPTCVEGSTRQCGKDTGACAFGSQACHDNIWGNCTGQIDPKLEACNMVDDDCDGTIDNGVPDTCQCKNNGVQSKEECDKIDNNCDGTIDNVAVQQACGCFGGAAPSIEVCDRSDNDCDGQIDEDLTSCPCAKGIPPTVERCDGIDNDCNGVIDNVADIDSCQCYGGKASGEELCDQVDNNCDGTIDNLNGTCPCSNGGFPQDEVCDRIDNDCSGVIDDVALGTCGCQGGNEPTTESCDNRDNDCDGTIDEDCQCDVRGGHSCQAAADCTGELWPGTDVQFCCLGPCSATCSVGETLSCSSDIGACEKGIYECIDGKWGACSGKMPIAETCNFIDDDCDGIVDDVNNAMSIAASACQCVGGSKPFNELCNGIDDNCNGEIDESCRQAKEACSDGIKNFNEAGVDCGGSCLPCKTLDNSDSIDDEDPYEEKPADDFVDPYAGKDDNVPTNDYENGYVDDATVESSQSGFPWLYLIIFAGLIITFLMYVFAGPALKLPGAVALNSSILGKKAQPMQSLPVQRVLPGQKIGIQAKGTQGQGAIVAMPGQTQNSPSKVIVPSVMTGHAPSVQTSGQHPAMLQSTPHNGIHSRIMNPAQPIQGPAINSQVRTVLPPIKTYARAPAIDQKTPARKNLVNKLHTLPESLTPMERKHLRQNKRKELREHAESVRKNILNNF